MDYTYTIEYLKLHIDKLNKEHPMFKANQSEVSHVEKMYHLNKIKQLLKAIEILQEETIKEK